MTRLLLVAVVLGILLTMALEHRKQGRPMRTPNPFAASLHGMESDDFQRCFVFHQRFRVGTE